MARLLYIETDGQVYLVRDQDGKWTFPTDGAPLDFSVVPLHETQIGHDDVVFCRAKLPRHPEHWVFKDKVPNMHDVRRVVRRAVNASLTRCVVGVLVRNRTGNVLMVRSSRGFTKGHWNMPGGFIEYGEHPADGAVRELEEETGLAVRLGRMLGVYMERFESPYFMYSFVYEATVDDETLRLNPDEIEEAQWMPAELAREATVNPFARKGLAELRDL